MRDGRGPFSIAEPVSRKDVLATSRAWFDESPLPMWICDADSLDLLEVNEAALLQYGMRREEFLSRRVPDLHPIDWQSGTLHAALCASRSFGCSISRRDGATIRLEIECTPIPYADRLALFAILRPAEDPDGGERESPDRVASGERRAGAVDPLLGTGVSPGAASPAAPKPRSSPAIEHEFLRAVFDSAPDAILFANDEHRYVDVNPAACELLGYTREELLSMPMLSITPVETRSRAEQAWRYLQECGRADGEIELEHKNGSRLRVDYRAVANVIPGLHVGFFRDARERACSEMQLRARARQQAALARIGERALAGLEHVALIGEATRAAAQALGAEHGAVLEWIAHDHRVVTRAEHLDSRLQAASGSEGLAAEALHVLATNEPAVFRDLDTETRFLPDHRLLVLGLTSGLAVLIPGRDHPYGVLAVHARTGHGFRQDERHFLQSVANLVALAGIRTEEQEMRNRVVERILTARDEERQKLAREIHDETGQSLTALLVGLVTVEHSRTVEETRALARQLRQITARTIEDLGRLARGLHPSILTDMGLAQAARRHVSDFQTSCGIPVELRIRGLERTRLRPRVETTLYRVLQEALTNCARHSEAKRIQVGLFRSALEVVLTVKDDGVGFDAGAQSVSSTRSGGLGLLGMRERVARAGGVLSIESGREHGTRLLARIPIRSIRTSSHRGRLTRKRTEGTP